MRYSLIAVAAASLAVAAPAGNQATSTSVAENAATDAAVATTPALDLSVLLEQLLAANGGAQFKTEMSQDERDAMREIESIFAELREQLQAIEGKQQQPQAAVSRRQLDFLSSLPIVGPLLGGLLGGVTGGGGAGGVLDLGGLTGGLTGILGRTRPEDLSAEEKEMMREAEVLMENFLREVAKNNQGENTQQQGEKHGVQRRQFDILFGLPIVGPLLQSLLGGVTGTVGGATGGAGAGGALGGLTGTLGGTLGGLTGGGGAGGALGGLTGTLGGTLGGLTGGGGAGGALGGVTGTLGGLTGELDLGSLLGKKPEDLHITEEQMAMVREADAILTEIAEQIEAEGRDQEIEN